MALFKFTLNDITAFKTTDRGEGSKHFCVGCSSQVKSQYTLVPFLDDHLHLTLSQFAQEEGAAMLCDLCGEVMATHYPENFWGDQTPEEKESSSAGAQS